MKANETKQNGIELTRRQMIQAAGAALGALSLTETLAASGETTLRPQASGTKANILLVHGAFADGSSWSKVIPALVKDGHHVIAVQNPLTSLADDVQNTRRVLDSLTGPTVLVGHSYGGMVITQAAHEAKNVKALVYLAAFAPTEGESVGDLLGKYPATILNDAIRPDPGGFGYIDTAKFREVFCADLDTDTALVLATAQKPIALKGFGEKVTGVAAPEIPTYYQISEDDRAINPDLERFLAKRLKAQTISLKSSHVAMLSHPKEVIALIKKAAQ